MRTAAEWFGEYHESHAHRTNQILHAICVPFIVLSLIGFLWSVPVPGAIAEAFPWLNWATLVSALALVYYVTLSKWLAVGAALVLAVMFAAVSALNDLPWPLWATSLVFFVLAWIGQFVGHAYEGKRPAFCKDLQFLLIGPLWLVAALYRTLRIPY
jgi:uncharacterized membrane protein YGL010W